MEIWRLKVDFGKNEEHEDYTFKGVESNREFFRYLSAKMESAEPLNGEFDHIELECLGGTKKVDFMLLSNAGNALLFSEKGKLCLDTIIGKDMEWIPTQYEGRTLYLGNMLTILDAVDYQKVTFRRLETGLAVGFEEYAFLEECIEGHHIFRVLFNGRKHTTETFVTTEFKNCVEENNLTGFTFIKVWESTN